MLYISDYGIELQITKAQAQSIYIPGRDCTPEVEALAKVTSITKQLKKLNPEKVAQQLKAYGVWSEDDLKDPNENLNRLLWIACGDINDRLGVSYENR